MNGQVTFWKSDFVGDNYEQLIAILKQYACKGEGYWFVVKANFVRALLPEDEYEWIMANVANYGNPDINK